MKSFVIYFCLLAFGGLGEAQTACSIEVALPFTFPSDAADLVNGGGNRTTDEVLAEREVISEFAENDIELIESSIKARSLRLRSLRLRSSLNKRADFSCTDNETCYTINNGIFCGNGQNGNFHEPDGTRGNLNTGDYVLADGQKGNLFFGPDPTLSGVVTPTSITASVPTKTATTNNRTESELSNVASITSNVPARTSSSGPDQTRNSSSESTTSISVEGASSSLEYPSFALTAVISMFAGSLVWLVLLF